MLVLVQALAPKTDPSSAAASTSGIRSTALRLLRSLATKINVRTSAEAAVMKAVMCGAIAGSRVSNAYYHTSSHKPTRNRRPPSLAMRSHKPTRK